MFCPSCGVANPDEAKFCNQCGGRVAPPTAQGAPANATSASQQGTASQQGFTTNQLAQSMVMGPTRRQMIASGVGIGLVGIAIGAVAAYRARRAPEPVPVTPVGLVGDPSPVTAPQTEETDAGTVVPVAPSPRSTRVAARTTPTPRTQTPARPAAPRLPGTTPTSAPETPEPDDDPDDPAPSNEGTPLPSGNTITRRADGTTVVTGPDGQPLVELTHGGNAPDAGAAPTPAAPTTPAAENGVVERGPRNSQGGYHMGDTTDANGTMNPQAFQFVYRHYQSQIATCWSNASRGSDVSGVMVVRVRIAEADGHVSRTRVISDSTHNAQLQACVQNQIRTWRYPRPEGGDVEVDYPLRFGGAR